MAVVSDPTKTLVILGSPRKKGNSAILADRIIQGIEASGGQAESVFLNGLNIKPCQSCYACQKPDSKGCAVDDDMQPIYPKLLESGCWVIATPVYWFNMSAQTKLWMDRCFALPAYADPSCFVGKRIAVAMSYGDADPFASGCVNALRCFQDSFKYVGAKLVGMVYGSALEAGDMNKSPEVLRQAEELGRRLVKAQS